MSGEKRQCAEGVDITQDRYTMSTESSSTQRHGSHPQSSIRSAEARRRISKLPSVNRTASSTAVSTAKVDSNPRTVCVDVVGLTVSQESSKHDSRYGTSIDLPEELLEDKTVTIICPGGVAPRLRISRNLQVLRVHESSLAANRLDPGDVVRKVNGKTVESRKEFYQLMSDIAKDPDCQAVRIDIKRPRRQQKLSKKEIFVELPKAFEILPGYDYFLGYMTVFPGCKIGIHIKSYNQKVYVSSTEPNSISSWTYVRGDAILSVEGIPVTAVRDTSQKIISALKLKKFVKSVIERPSTPATFRFANYALQYSKKSEIDPKMADDVIEICKREIVFWRGSRTPIARPSILRKKTQYQEAQQKSTVAIATKSTEIGIACEAVNPQWLQSVPERCTGDEYEKVTEWVANRRVAKPSPTDSRSKRKRAKGKGVSKKSFRTRRQP